MSLWPAPKNNVASDTDNSDNDDGPGQISIQRDRRSRAFAYASSIQPASDGTLHRKTLLGFGTGDHSLSFNGSLRPNGNGTSTLSGVARKKDLQRIGIMGFDKPVDDDDYGRISTAPVRSAPGVVVLKKPASDLPPLPKPSSPNSNNPKDLLANLLQKNQFDKTLRLIDVDLNLKIERLKIKVNEIQSPFLSVGCVNLPHPEDVEDHPELAKCLVHAGGHRYSITIEKVTFQIHLHAIIVARQA